MSELDEAIVKVGTIIISAAICIYFIKRISWTPEK